MKDNLGMKERILSFSNMVFTISGFIFGQNNLLPGDQGFGLTIVSLAITHINITSTYFSAIVDHMLQLHLITLLFIIKLTLY